MKIKKLIAPCLIVLTSLGLCIGTTYALFSSKDENNIATSSGKVKLTSNIEDLELYSPTAINLDGSIKDDTNGATDSQFLNGGTATLEGGDLILNNITPGDKVSFKIKFNNQSNVSIKYHVLCDDITEYSGTETHKLIDVLEVKEGTKTIKYGYPLRSWTKVEPNESIGDMQISIELPTTVENEYSHLSCKIAFSTEAVQANAKVEDAQLLTIHYMEDPGSSSYVQIGDKEKIYITQATMYSQVLAGETIYMYSETSRSINVKKINDDNPEGIIVYQSSENVQEWSGTAEAGYAYYLEYSFMYS